MASKESFGGCPNLKQPSRKVGSKIQKILVSTPNKVFSSDNGYFLLIMYVVLEGTLYSLTKRQKMQLSSPAEINELPILELTGLGTNSRSSSIRGFIPCT